MKLNESALIDICNYFNVKTKKELINLLRKKINERAKVIHCEKKEIHRLKQILKTINE